MDNEIQDISFQDTKPGEFDVEEKDLEHDTEEAVIPNGEYSVEEKVARDAEIPSAQNPASDNKVVPEPFITVQYNHKNRDFTKEEAINFIQKGMHTESLRSKLEYLAREQKTDINSLVDNLISGPETQYRKRLESLYGVGSEEVEIGMKIYRQQQSEEYKNIIENLEAAKRYDDTKKCVNSRLADEYLYLKQQIPEAPEYSALPDSVILEAANGRRDLFSAYLCHLHEEKEKIDAAKKSKDAASTASLGEMGNCGNDFANSLERDFVVGLWSK